MSALPGARSHATPLAPAAEPRLYAVPPGTPTTQLLPVSGKEESHAHGFGDRRPPLAPGTGLSIAEASPERVASLVTNDDLSIMWDKPCRICTPQNAFPKLKLQPQKLFARLNSTSM